MSVPHSSKYLPGIWRGWFEFGNGALGDWACHNMDAPYDVFDLDLPSKVELESTGPKKLSFPAGAKITYTFPAVGDREEMKVNWYQGEAFRPPRAKEMEDGRELGGKGGGTLIVGSEATVVMSSHAGTPSTVPYAKQRKMAPSPPKPNLRRSSHWDNWLRAIKGEEKTRSNFAYSGRLTEVMQYGNIAMHLNRGLTIDPAKREIVGDEEATALAMGPTPREGWEI